MAELPVLQILRKLLPPNIEVPTSFETVGHIAHLNLRDDQLPYKHLIGQVCVRGVFLPPCVPACCSAPFFDITFGKVNEFW